MIGLVAGIALLCCISLLWRIHDDRQHMQFLRTCIECWHRRYIESENERKELLEQLKNRRESR